MFKNVGDMMKQAQSIQERMSQIQKQFSEYRMEAVSGGGLVKVVLNGKRDLLDLSIDPSLLKAEEKEVLEDLIVAAMQEATRKVDLYIQDEMKKISAGMPMV